LSGDAAKPAHYQSSFDAETTKQITDALTAHGVNKPCFRCGNNTWRLGTGYFSFTVQPDIYNLTLGGPHVPAILLSCSRCGFLAFHSTLTLGIQPPPKGAQ